MLTYELAQLNVAVLRMAMDSPGMADFVANIDRINGLAESADGFVWRLKDDSGNATALRPFGPDMLVNVSVWRDIEALRSYVYESGHVDIMRRRREWFDRAVEATSVLWWIPAGHRPTESEASQKLQLLRSEGATAQAFTFGKPFPPPE